MKDFSGRLAVVTGGGAGIGRALVRRLAAEGCSVATCDIRAEEMDKTVALAASEAPQGVKLTTFVADVAIEDQLAAFAEDVRAQHGLDHIHLLINNAGIGGGGGFVNGPRGQWERTFGVCWWGVYYGCRVFMPMLLRADEGHVVNVSSVNGFWASLGPDRPHTAYSAAKFAVKGFTEALRTDLKVNAPHVTASVVMPGHIGTRIAHNSFAEFQTGEGPPEQRAMADAFEQMGLPPAEAARIILEGVKAGRWRILVGPDAERLDRAVRADPEGIYDLSMAELVARGA